MQGNRGRTSLKSKLRREDPMREFDRLPPVLRGWLARAVLPWRPRSVQDAFQRAWNRTRSTELALEELDRIEMRLIARDSLQIWGADHPCAAGEARP